MSNPNPSDGSNVEERDIQRVPGMPVLLLNLATMLGAFAVSIVAIMRLEEGYGFFPTGYILILALLWACVVAPVLFAGLKVLKPNEALVLTLFGKYTGTLKGPGYFFVNPFSAAVCPNSMEPNTGMVASEKKPESGDAFAQAMAQSMKRKSVSLKAMTLSNDKQKVNDALGNPIIIGIVVIWRVVNTAKAVFNVDNYPEYLSIQCDSALRNIVRLYPYDLPEEEGEKSLRGSSQEIAESLKKEIQAKVELAGLEILEARITHLSYAPEIAAAMLQRQQASAIIAARQMIVEGAVGMVEMALDKLKVDGVVNLDEERKAAMVSNLLVVLCGSKEAQPVLNSGSIY